jgi:hypothetical protein
MTSFRLALQTVREFYRSISVFRPCVLSLLLSSIHPSPFALFIRLHPTTVVVTSFVLILHFDLIHHIPTNNV